MVIQRKQHQEKLTLTPICKSLTFNRWFHVLLHTQSQKATQICDTSLIALSYILGKFSHARNVA